VYGWVYHYRHASIRTCVCIVLRCIGTIVPFCLPTPLFLEQAESGVTCRQVRFYVGSVSTQRGGGAIGRSTPFRSGDGSAYRSVVTAAAGCGSRRRCQCDTGSGPRRSCCCCRCCDGDWLQVAGGHQWSADWRRRECAGAVTRERVTCSYCDEYDAARSLNRRHLLSMDQ